MDYRKSMFCSLCSVIRCSVFRCLEGSGITGGLFIGFGGIFILSGVCSILSENIQDNVSATFKKVEKILITDMSV